MEQEQPTKGPEGVSRDTVNTWYLLAVGLSAGLVIGAAIDTVITLGRLKYHVHRLAQLTRIAQADIKHRLEVEEHERKEGD